MLTMTYTTGSIVNIYMIEYHQSIISCLQPLFSCIYTVSKKKLLDNVVLEVYSVNPGNVKIDTATEFPV